MNTNIRGTVDALNHNIGNDSIIVIQCWVRSGTNYYVTLHRISDEEDAIPTCVYMRDEVAKKLYSFFYMLLFTLFLVLF